MKLEQKQQEIEYTEALYKWLQALFKYKAMDLISERAAIGALIPIHKAIEDRTLHFDRLIMLKGKLDLLLQLNERTASTKEVAPKYEAVNVLDENVEEEIEGVEVMDIKEYKSTKEMMAETELPVEQPKDKRKDSDEDIPDVVVDENEEPEDNKLVMEKDKESGSEKMEDEKNE